MAAGFCFAFCFFSAIHYPSIQVPLTAYILAGLPFSWWHVRAFAPSPPRPLTICHLFTAPGDRALTSHLDLFLGAGTTHTHTTTFHTQEPAPPLVYTFPTFTFPTFGEQATLSSPVA